MAKSKKQPAGDESADPEWTFEQSLTELQQIVDELEAGQLGLDESMRRFEQGIALLRRCYGTLEATEQKIEVLTGIDAGGRPVTEPFDGTSTVQQKQAAGRRRSPSAGETPDEAPSENGDQRKRLF